MAMSNLHDESGVKDRKAFMRAIDELSPPDRKRPAAAGSARRWPQCERGGQQALSLIDNRLLISDCLRVCPAGRQPKSPSYISDSNLAAR